MPRIDIKTERESGTVFESSEVYRGIAFHAIRPPKMQKMRPAAEEMWLHRMAEPEHVYTSVR